MLIFGQVSETHNLNSFENSRHRQTVVLLHSAADTWRLSLALPMFKDAPPEAAVPLSEVAEWLAAHIVDDSSLPGGCLSLYPHTSFA